MKKNGQAEEIVGQYLHGISHFDETWLIKKIRYTDTSLAEAVYWLLPEEEKTRNLKMLLLRSHYSDLSKELIQDSYTLDKTRNEKFSENLIQAYLKTSNCPVDIVNELLDMLFTQRKPISRFVHYGIRQVFAAHKNVMEINRYSPETQDKILKLHPELKPLWHTYLHSEGQNKFQVDFYNRECASIMKASDLPDNWSERLNDDSFTTLLSLMVDSSYFIKSQYNDQYVGEYGEIGFLYAYLINKRLNESHKFYTSAEHDVAAARAYELVKERYEIDFNGMAEQFIIYMLPGIDDREFLNSVFPPEKDISFS